MVASALYREPSRWLPGLAAQADACAQALLIQVGLGGHSHRIDKLVDVGIGDPISFHGNARIPIRWRASGASRLFPTLDASLEVSPLGEGRTQLALSGTYEVPFGYLGELADRALLHRVAETTVKSFVDALALTVEATVAGPATAGDLAPR